MAKLMTLRASLFCRALASLSCLTLLATAGCAEQVVTPAILGSVQEVPIERPNPRDSADDLANARWRVGSMRANVPIAEDQPHNVGLHNPPGVYKAWNVQAEEATKRPWTAACMASSYMSQAKVGAAIAFAEPTAVVCDVAQHGDEAFHLELTNAGPDRGIGRLHDPSGVVTIDRAERPWELTRVPDSFLLRHDGVAVAWLRTRPAPRLFVVPGLDRYRQTAIERAAMLTLALDTHAARQFRGTALQPALWARSDTPQSIAIAPAPVE